MTLSPYQAAATDPVSLDEIKVALEIIDYEHDDHLLGLIKSATSEAEHYMGRALLPQKWILAADSFCSKFTLQRPPVTAVDSIKYVDLTGVLVTLSSSVYQVAALSEYTATVQPAFGQVWPSARAQPEAVQIVFSCGYADAASVPASIKDWIKQRVTTLFENRGSIFEGKVAQLDFTSGLLDRYRTWLF